MTPAEKIMQKNRQARKRMIQRKLDRISVLIAESAFLLRIDHPEGALFVEGEGSINALTDTHDLRREHSVLASARFDKGDCHCGAW
jgi:hypothetical protein